MKSEVPKLNKYETSKGGTKADGIGYGGWILQYKTEKLPGFVGKGGSHSPMQKGKVTS